MARKSNKTAHVLSLLTDPKRETSETSSVETPPSAPTAPIEQPASAEPVSSAETIPAETPEPSVQTVVPQPEPVISSAAPIEVPDETPASVEPPAPSLPAIDSAQAAEERLSKRIQSSLADALAAEETIPSPTPSPKPPPVPPRPHTAATPPQKEAEPSVPEVTAATPKPAAAFVLVNVMDELIDRIQDDIMQKFGMCTCERCRLDTRALALSNLSSKYVVLNVDSVSPMLNFYEHRYQGAITAQLTQACRTVMQHPHHTDEKNLK